MNTTGVNTGIQLTSVSLNDYLEAVGEGGYEWFESSIFDEHNLNAYYDSEYYGEVNEEIAEEANERFPLDLNDRFEPQVVIDENGHAELAPIMYDNAQNRYLTLDEFAEAIREAAPAEVEIYAQVNPTFSWENGWECDEEKLKVSLRDVDYESIAKKMYEDIRDSRELDNCNEMYFQADCREVLEGYMNESGNKQRYDARSETEQSHSHKTKKQESIEL